MLKKNPNKKYLNKLLTLKIVGKGEKGDYFGKTEKIVCFINDSGNSMINIGDVVDVKVANISNTCLFCEVLSDES